MENMVSEASSIKKNSRIQILRAIAIICVCIIHTTPNGLYQVFIRPFTNIAVATFIFIFGYLTPVDIPNILQFYNKRILRVIIPYMLWIFIYSLVKRDLSIIIFNYIPWFMNINYPPIINILWDNSFLGWFSYFYFGIMLSNLIINIPRPNKILVYLIITICLQMVEGYLLMNIGISNCGTQLKCSTLITCFGFLCYEYNYIKKENEIDETFLTKLMISIGNCSFGIYLSHILVKMLISKFVPILFYPLNSLMVFIVSYLLVLLGQKLFGHKISKIIGLE